MQSNSQVLGDSILGNWIVEGETAKVKIYQTNNGTYSGKLIWLENETDETGKLIMDLNNPNEELRQRPLIGIDIIQDFLFDERKKEWMNGKIYDPTDGKLYFCRLKLKDDITLSVKGSIDKWSLIGESQTWKREL